MKTKKTKNKKVKIDINLSNSQLKTIKKLADYADLSVNDMLVAILVIRMYESGQL